MHPRKVLGVQAKQNNPIFDIGDFQPVVDLGYHLRQGLARCEEVLAINRIVVMKIQDLIRTGTMVEDGPFLTIAPGQQIVTASTPQDILAPSAHHVVIALAEHVVVSSALHSVTVRATAKRVALPSTEYQVVTLTAAQKIHRTAALDDIIVLGAFQRYRFRSRPHDSKVPIGETVTSSGASATEPAGSCYLLLFGLSFHNNHGRREGRRRC